MHRPTPGNLPGIRENLSPQVRAALLRLAAGSHVPLYLVGGTVRDWLMGRRSGDIDIAAACSAGLLAKQLQMELGGGTIIDLSGPEDEAVRLVWRGEQFDFAAFRGGAATIDEDLQLRDFTVNAMALPLTALADDGPWPCVCDPTSGLADLHCRVIKHCSGAFVADPLRLLRGYRLSATLGFTPAAETRQEVRRYAALIDGVAAERRSYELRLIFTSHRTAPTLQMMAEDRLLAVLLPELFRGEGVAQPEFHHLDVLGHSMLALSQMEEILAAPEHHFPGQADVMAEYLQQDNASCCLKWAALLHDVGKPATRERQTDGRVTFYRHDEEGVRIFESFAGRSRWSRADTQRTSRLIAMHMHPFHLCNVMRESRISRRAALKLCMRAEGDMAGVFLLAMADSLASKGEKKPERMEAELQELFAQVRQVYTDHIQPTLSGPRLLTGKDLIKEFNLVPGPLFAKLLHELEVARVEGVVTDRGKALRFIAAYLETVSPSR